MLMTPTSLLLKLQTQPSAYFFDVWTEFSDLQQLKTTKLAILPNHKLFVLSSSSLQ